jgi:hypothetical protein
MHGVKDPRGPVGMTATRKRGRRWSQPPLGDLTKQMYYYCARGDRSGFLQQPPIVPVGLGCVGRIHRAKPKWNQKRSLNFNGSNSTERRNSTMKICWSEPGGIEVDSSEQRMSPLRNQNLCFSKGSRTLWKRSASIKQRQKTIFKRSARRQAFTWSGPRGAAGCTEAHACAWQSY